MGKPNFKGKKVLILGLGLNEGGLGAARFFARHGAYVRVTDLKDERTLKPSIDKLWGFSNIQYVLGQHRKGDIDWADLVIRNQALRPNNEYLQYAYKKGKEVEMDIGVFLKSVDLKQIIGVTGTKGKTTTASLIYYAVKEKYPNSVLAGNIGVSVLDALDEIDRDALVVLELSSFQLQEFEEHRVSPHIAVITNIYPDHLNYHKDMDEYINLKKAIAKYQKEKDYLFINKDDATLNSEQFLEGLGGKIIYFPVRDLPEDFKPTLPGEHNRANYAAALAVAKIMDITEDEALRNMNQFGGAEYRLEKIYDQGGIRIYNDSAATNPDATVEALKTFNNAILICGGVDKKLDYQKLAEQIDRSVKAVYFLAGDATEKIKEHIKHQEILRSTYEDIEKLLADVKLEVKDGGVVLFSPAGASFNLFQNEFDRGRKFNLAVERVFK